MQTLYLGKKIVGEVGDDGSVYAGAGRKRRQIATVTPGGDILVDGYLVGSVDDAGVVYNAEGRNIGSVNPRGAVSRGGRPFGSIEGTDPLRAGGALLLIFGGLPQPPKRLVEPASDDGYGWIAWLVGGTLALAAIFFVVTVVIATAIVWGVMLLLASVTALWMAGAVARSLSEDERAAVTTVTMQTKRGERTEVDPTFLRIHLKPFPILFLCLVPALGYGIVVSCLAATQSRPGDQSSVAFAGAAVAAGAVVSYLAARKILYRNFGHVLMRTDTRLTFAPNDWNRRGGYAGGGLALLLCISGGVAAWHSAHQPAMQSIVQPQMSAVATSSPSGSASTTNTAGSTNSGISQQAPAPAQPSAGITPSLNTARLPGEHFPQTHTAILSDVEVRGWSYSGVRYALNEMYARHHFPFKSAPIRHQFEQFPWYQADESVTNASTEAQFTPIERANQHTLARRRDALRLAGQAIK